ncbi:hypothetical protein BGY98DRAFT_1011058 [Russula aff. rugulosa BPL654]|nr:hypothetical protein BGY98DRAFT_1011058 [Russula aff. rugulosa BPL654]
MLTGNDIVPHPTLRILTLRSPKSRAISLSNSVRRPSLRLRTQHFLTIPLGKLREGISSSRRHDQFAIEEASSSLTVLLASLHSLERHYPSQRAFFDLSKSLPPSFTLRDDHQVWLRDLSCSLRRVGSETPDQKPLNPEPDLALLSLQTLVAGLRDRLRLSAWCAVRSAYREFALPQCDTAHVETGKQDTRKDGDRVQLWFTSREDLGEVVRKDGVDGRWAVKLKK